MTPLDLVAVVIVCVSCMTSVWVIAERWFVHRDRAVAQLVKDTEIMITEGNAAASPRVGGGGARRPGGGGGGRAQAPNAQAPAGAGQPAAPGEAAPGRPIWDRAPTRDEIQEDPRRASQERLVQMFARENHLDLSNVDDRRAAAGAVNAMSTSQVGELTNRASERTTQQHSILMREFEPRRHRREVLGSLRQRSGAVSRPVLLAALHGGPSMARVAGASELRADLKDFMNNYFRETGGAAISDSEAERYRSALGIDSTVVDPSAFLSFLSRRMGNLDAEMDSLREQYPDGWQRYVENHRRR